MTSGQMPKWAGAFLSYARKDTDLVTAVAEELSQMGIIPWLDTYELEAGQSITQTLDRAIAGHSAFILFLSPEAARSDWVRQEITQALEAEARQGENIIIPVLLGSPDLILNHDQLKAWVHPDGSRVDKKYIHEEHSNADAAEQVAKQSARRIFTLMGVKEKQEIVICLDQRGSGGRRTGAPDWPPSLPDAGGMPGLVFRQDPGGRKKDTMVAGQWDAIRGKIQWALENAIGDPKGKTIRIMGRAQLALAFFLGRHFDRTSYADLICHNSMIPEEILTNVGQERRVPLEGGNAFGETGCGDIPPIAEGYRGEAAALFLMRKAHLRPALAHWKAVFPRVPGIWKDHGILDQEALMTLAGDIVALIQRLDRNHGICTIFLYTTLPFHALPIVAATLQHVVQKRLVFMDFRRDFQGKDMPDNHMYIALDMP